MKNKKLVIVLSVMVMALVLSGFSPFLTPTADAAPAPQNVQQAAPSAKVTKLAMDYFANFPEDRNMITAKNLFAKMDAKESMLIVDIRRPDDYNKGHLTGAINIPYGKAIAEGLEILPNDKPIMVYCYSGQTGAQAVVMMNIAGKKAKNIVSGFNGGISKTENFDKYMNTEKVAAPAKTYKTDAKAKAAVAKYFNDAAALAGTKMVSFNIAPSGVKAIIDSKDNSYFILSVRSAKDYKAGDIPTAVNIPFGKGMEQKFSTLPQNKKIIVSCYSGQTASQTMAVLRLLGYDAYNMTNGMGKADNPKSGWLGEGYPTAGQPIAKAEDKPSETESNNKDNS